MSQTLFIEPLSASKFAAFGDIIEAVGEPDMMINRDNCARFHNLANIDVIDGSTGISVFNAKHYSIPLTLDLMERHPLGSQAFIPMSTQPFLVIVAEDVNGSPGRPKVFITKPGQGVNYHRNIWHGVLTPLKETALFTVVDRIGEGNNLEEHVFEDPFIIQALY